MCNRNNNLVQNLARFVTNLVLKKCTYHQDKLSFFLSNVLCFLFFVVSFLLIFLLFTGLLVGEYVAGVEDFLLFGEVCTGYRSLIRSKVPIDFPPVVLNSSSIGSLIIFTSSLWFFFFRKILPGKIFPGKDCKKSVRKWKQKHLLIQKKLFFVVKVVNNMQQSCLLRII